jgi:CBS domain-containing protein
MRVKEVMNKVVVIDSNISLRAAAKIMSDKNIGSLIILNKDNILGMITEKDIVDNASNLDKKVTSIKQRKIITVEQDESLDTVAIIMSKNKIKRLPVMRDGKLTGIITATDLLANSEELDEDFFID